MTKETGINYEVDHIIPLQGKLASGLHVYNNLQIITQSENRSKNNKYTPKLELCEIRPIFPY
jgi:5-methylcytosine-specific restriction endonuclease McrA